MKAVAPHDTQQRLKEEVQASKNATPYGEAHKEALKSWDMGVKELDASMNDLGATVGTRLIGALRPLLDVMSSFLKWRTTLQKTTRSPPTLALRRRLRPAL